MPENMTEMLLCYTTKSEMDRVYKILTDLKIPEKTNLKALNQDRPPDSGLWGSSAKIRPITKLRNHNKEHGLAGSLRGFRGHLSYTRNPYSIIVQLCFEV